MKLPENFDCLLTEKLKGPYLEEFLRALEGLKPSGNRGDPKANSTQSAVYDFLIENVRPLIANASLTGKQLQEIISKYNLNKEVGISALDHAGVTNAVIMTGDIMTGMGFGRAATLSTRVFLECLSLQDGWHRNLLSLYLRGERFLSADNITQLSGQTGEQLFEPNMPHRVKISARSSKKVKYGNPEMYAYDFLRGLERYTESFGRSGTTEIARGNEIFNFPYDVEPKAGMSGIFQLGLTLNNYLKLTAACHQAVPQIAVDTFLADVATKHSLTLPQVHAEVASTGQKQAVIPLRPKAPAVHAPDDYIYQ